MKVASLILLLLFCPNAISELSVTLAWDKNPEPDIATYRLYWGTNSAQYNQCTNTGLSTNCTISALLETQSYYFACTAINEAGLESDFSNEVSYHAPIWNLNVYYQSAVTLTGIWTTITQFSLEIHPPNTQQFYRAYMTIR